MLTNLLPGLREIRAPLVSGYLWVAFFFLLFHDDLPSSSHPESVVRPIFEIGEHLSVLGVAAVTGVAAYLVGSAMQELWKLLGQLGSPGRPLYGEAGIRTTGAGRRDVEVAVQLRIEGIKRKLYQVALAPGEKGVDEEPTPDLVERELPLIRTLLLGERPELVGELDRLQAEADLRITVAFPLAAFALFLAFESSLGWLAILPPAALLIAQGYQRQLEAGDLLAKALRIGKADAPALASITASADAALERVELEGALRKEMDGGDGMAAFRLGNLQASWDDFEAAITSLEFAAGRGIVRAYAEVGLVHERCEDPSKAERAYRDGTERSDKKCRELLMTLLKQQGRSDEALATAGKRVEDEVEKEQQEPVELTVPGEGSRIASYRKRIKGGDAKAAINLGLLMSARGDLDEAVEAFKQATVLDPDDAGGWLNLGGVEMDRVRSASAREALERGLAAQEEDLGPEHLSVAISMGNLGCVLEDDFGLIQQANKLHERALEIKERELGRDSASLSMARGLCNLGNNLCFLGRYQEAAELHERAMRAAEKGIPPEHLEQSVIKRGLARSMTFLGRYERGRDLYEQALSIKERLRGPDHPHVASVLEELGWVLGLQGELGPARELQERALGIAEETLEADNLGFGVILGDLANTVRASGDRLEARELHEQALRIKKGVLGDKHLGFALTLSDLGETVREIDGPQAALEMLERAVSIADVAPNGRHPDLAVILVRFAAAVQELGSPDRAATALSEAIAIQEEALGLSHPALASSYELMAEIKGALGLGEEAAAASDRARRIRSEGDSV